MIFAYILGVMVVNTFMPDRTVQYEESKMKTSMFKFTKKLLGFSAFLLFAGQAYAVNLPAPSCGLGPTNNCLTFGDFNVYSLGLLNLAATGDFVPNSGDPFFAPSTYGAIKNNTVIGINNGKSTNTGNPSTTTDGAYNTPSPNNATSGTFSTMTGDTGFVSDPTGGPAAGDGNSWDTTVGALNTLTGGTGNIVAYFAFNETGKGTGLLTTDLLVWARITLYEYDFSTGGLITPGPSFYLSGDGSSTIPGTSAGDLPAADGSDANGSGHGGTDPGFGPWVYVHAGICVAADGSVSFPLTDGSCPSGATSGLQNNLGQNAAAFAINSPDLDAAFQGAVATGTYNVLSIDWKMAYINGGGETTWIMPTVVDVPQEPPYCETHPNDSICQPITVPEPNILALLGLGLTALGLSRFGRRQRI